jgi:guanine deaminase
MCLGAIYWARPDVVFFAATKKDAARGGFDDAFIYEEINKNNDQRTISFIQKNIQGCAHVFDEWLQSANKIEY